MIAAHDLLEEAQHSATNHLHQLAAHWALRYEGITPTALLRATQNTLKQRGAYRDDGTERVMPQIVERFNARRNAPNLTTTQGYHFMIDLKLARLERNPTDIDSIIDLIGYTALLSEHLTRNPP